MKCLGLSEKQSLERACVRPKEPSVGLSLSGGGYRSAIFGYGVLKGLYKLGVLGQFDYLSAVSGGSWLATAFCLSEDLQEFFNLDESMQTRRESNWLEQGFEHSLFHPGRMVQEMLLSELNKNYLSNVYGRLLGKKFLKERIVNAGRSFLDVQMGQRGLFDHPGRPFLIVNGSVHRSEGSGGWGTNSERFEMTPLFSGCSGLGYVSTCELFSSNRALRVRDALAISGAALSCHLHVPFLETLGFGLSREVLDYTDRASSGKTSHLDLSDGGFVDNLGLGALVDRGCTRAMVVDAEYDPEHPRACQSGQAYESLYKWIDGFEGSAPARMREKIQASGMEEPDRMVTYLQGIGKIPTLLYIKLKSNRSFDRHAEQQASPPPNGSCSFEPHRLETYEWDYSFAEHRTLSNLGEFVMCEHAQAIQDFLNLPCKGR